MNIAMRAIGQRAGQTERDFDFATGGETEPKPVPATIAEVIQGGTRYFKVLQQDSSFSSPSVKTRVPWPDLRFASNSRFNRRFNGELQSHWSGVTGLENRPFTEFYRVKPTKTDSKKVLPVPEKGPKRVFSCTAGSPHS